MAQSETDPLGHDFDPVENQCRRCRQRLWRHLRRPMFCPITMPKEHHAFEVLEEHEREERAAKKELKRLWRRP